MLDDEDGCVSPKGGVTHETCPKRESKIKLLEDTDCDKNFEENSDVRVAGYAGAARDDSDGPASEPLKLFVETGASENSPQNQDRQEGSDGDDIGMEMPF